MPSSSPPNSYSSFSPLQKKQKMTLTQTYYLAHTARAKLSKEAARSDHDLRLLVGHANLLDGLMIDLAEAEREQESWFNQTVNGASSSEEQQQQQKSGSKHVQWAESLPAVTEDYEEDSDDDSDSDADDESEFAEVSHAAATPLRRAPTPPSASEAMDVDDEDDGDDEDDDEEDYEDLRLTRTPSRSSPPELLLESDDDSDDDSMPPSPPAPEMQLDEDEDAFATKQRRKQRRDSIQQHSEEAFYEDGFYLPQRQTVAIY